MAKQSPQQTVLIVDDQPSNVDILHDVLRADYRVKVALNGDQALNLAQSGSPPDMILLDIMMPGMDGYEVCRRLKSNPFTRSIPVIFVTAMSDAVDESNGFELGAVDYITKPITPPLVLARVRAQLALYDQSRSLEEMVRKRTEELQQANQRLVQERARFEWVVRTASDGYLILDRQGCISFANAQACNYLGTTPDKENTSEQFIELIKRRYRLEPREAWETPLTQITTQPRYLIQPESAHAPAFWLVVDIFEISIVEQDHHWVVRLHDATEEVTTRRNWATFTEMVNHKLRTPLAVTTGSIDLLARHSSDLPVEEISSLAKTAQRGIERLRKTTEDVLAYMETQRMVQNGEGFNLAGLHTLATDVAASLEIDQIAVACCRELQNSTLAISRRAMELVVWELFENAHKFHPRKSPVVDLMVMPPVEGMARIQIRDDGLTLTPVQLARLWSPYYQAEKSFSGEIPGMGLGLAQVASLIWNVGGKCRAYNRDDSPGLIIELLIPLQESLETDQLPID